MVRTPSLTRYEQAAGVVRRILGQALIARGVSDRESCPPSPHHMESETEGYPCKPPTHLLTCSSLFLVVYEIDRACDIWTGGVGDPVAEYGLAAGLNQGKTTPFKHCTHASLLIMPRFHLSVLQGDPRDEPH